MGGGEWGLGVCGEVVGADGARPGGLQGEFFAVPE